MRACGDGGIDGHSEDASAQAEARRQAEEVISIRSYEDNHEDNVCILVWCLDCVL